MNSSSSILKSLLGLSLFAIGLAPAAQGRVILNAHFNSTNEWPGGYSTAVGPVNRTRTLGPVGNIDNYNSTAGTALSLVVNAAGATSFWSSTLRSGTLTATNTEGNVARLTFSFDLWVNKVHPVYARVYSAGGGYKEFIINPPVAGSYYRQSLDLDKATTTTANFNPTAATFEFEFGIRSNDPSRPWPSANGHEIRIDNITFASPRYYVSSTLGSNANTGATSASGANGPLATIQEAMNRATAGDIICVMNGEYPNPFSFQPTLLVDKKGFASRWIVVRAFPGHTPVIKNNGTFNAVLINSQAAYIEIRGLTIRGNAATINALTNPSGLQRATDDGALQFVPGTSQNYFGNPLYNGNGISIDSRRNTALVVPPASQRAHHIRILDNVVYENSGVGIGAIEADYITIAGNRSHANCWFMRSAGSGITVFHNSTFDQGTNYKTFVIGNTVYDNECFVKWARFRTDTSGNPIPDVISDGNGIIIDDLQNTQLSTTIPLQNVVNPGRVLVQNNVSYRNGGAGIQTLKSDRVVITNNTTYNNNLSPSLNYGEIFINQSPDNVVANNILWAVTGKNILAGGTTPGITVRNNLYTRNDNVSITPIGTGSIWISYSDALNLLFVNNFSRDFRLKAGSKAINIGSATVLGAPIADIVNVSRPKGTGANAPDAGAYEF